MKPLRRLWIKRAVVYVPEKDSKRASDGLKPINNEEEAQQRIASQWPIEMKKNEQISCLITRN